MTDRPGRVDHVRRGMRPARPWRALITRTNRCAVQIGPIGLWAERARTRIETLLGQAADAEELAGGLVEAHC